MSDNTYYPVAADSPVMKTIKMCREKCGWFLYGFEACRRGSRGCQLSGEKFDGVRLVSPPHQ